MTIFVEASPYIFVTSNEVNGTNPHVLNSHNDHFPSASYAQAQGAEKAKTVFSALSFYGSPNEDDDGNAHPNVLPVIGTSRPSAAAVSQRPATTQGFAPSHHEVLGKPRSESEPAKLPSFENVFPTWVDGLDAL